MNKLHSFIELKKDNAFCLLPPLLPEPLETFLHLQLLKFGFRIYRLLLRLSPSSPLAVKTNQRFSLLTRNRIPNDLV